MNCRTDIQSQLEPLKVLAPAGFAMALHIRFTTPAYLFQTYPKGWIDYYSQNGLVMRDPTVIWGFDNTGIVRWSDLSDKDPHKIMDAAAKHGMKYGFTCVTDKGDSRSLCSFARADRDFTDAEISDITAIVDKMHEQTASLESLSPETREALRVLSIHFTHP